MQFGDLGRGGLQLHLQLVSSLRISLQRLFLLLEAGDALKSNLALLLVPCTLSSEAVWRLSRLKRACV